MRFRHGVVEYHLTFKPRRRQLGMFLKVRDLTRGRIVLLQHMYITYAGGEVAIAHDAVHGLRGYEDDKVAFENSSYTYEYDRIRDKILKKPRKLIGSSWDS